VTMEWANSHRRRHPHLGRPLCHSSRARRHPPLAVSAQRVPTEDPGRVSDGWGPLVCTVWRIHGPGKTHLHVVHPPAEEIARPDCRAALSFSGEGRTK